MRARWLAGACTGVVLVVVQAAAQSGPASTVPVDGYQRSADHYVFKATAPNGPQRGEELYYYKCWFCHNEFVKDVPHVEGLYKKATLLSGEPVNDNTVKEKIRNGGPGMAAYKYTLNDADLNDLVSYLREKCCWDSDAPPPNPRYIAR